MRHPPHSVLLVSDGPAALERCPADVLGPGNHGRVARWDKSSPARGTASSRVLSRSTAETPTHNSAPTTFKRNGTACTVDANPAVAPVNTGEVLVAHIQTHGMKSPLEP